MFLLKMLKSFLPIKTCRRNLLETDSAFTSLCSAEGIGSPSDTKQHKTSTSTTVLNVAMIDF